MRLHDPWMLALLALIPLWLWLRGRRSRSATLRFPTLDVIRRVPAGLRRWHWVPFATRVVAVGLVIVALARPQFGKAESEFRGEGIDLVLAVDISGSMLAEDFTLPNGGRASRLDVVKTVVKDFIAGRPADRFGLVLFAGRPYTQCPLTLDHGWLLQNLDRAQIGMIEDGTAVGSALATAAARLEHSTAKSKVVILLTDGQSNAGRITPATAADAAKSLGIKVYTIGAGTKGMAPFPGRDMFGNKVYQPMAVDIDETTLKDIASKTGGRYFRATDTASLQDIWAEIDKMERTEFSAPRYLDYYEVFPWLIVPALLLVFADLLLANTRLRTLP